MADEPENLVLEMLRRLDAKVDRLDTKVDRVVADQTAMKTEQRTHSRTLGIVLQEGRLMRAAVNDIAKENVTSGEMEAVHDDLTQLRQEVDGLTVRIEMIEEHQKDH
jgi:ubiquinone biosynthesis protein UbiJ